MKVKVNIACCKHHCSLRLCPFHFINLPEGVIFVERNLEFKEGCRRKGTYKKLHPEFDPYRKERKQ